MITGNRYHGMKYRDYTERIINRQRIKMMIPDTGYDNTTPPLIAYVNRGRWLVDCPDCHGCEWVWDEGWMLCMSCFNGYMQGKFRRVEFPRERKEIEQLLILRPISNRNWNNGEPVQRLAQENEEHKEKLLWHGQIPPSTQRAR